VNATALPGFSVEAFERGEIDPEAFDHEAHVYAVWRYLERFPLPAALLTSPGDKTPAVRRTCRRRR
jgi:hypothetical protein